MQARCRQRKMAEMVLSEPLVRQNFSEKANHCCNGQAFSTSCLSARENKLICVTSGNSYLGSHIVKQLLAHGYLVRVTIQNPVDYEDMRRLIKDEDVNKLENIVVAKMQNLDSLCNAFRGCQAVFHTSSFIDPHGISGYSEQMAFLEAEAARNVMEACGSAENVKRCIFTSSLLASIWIGENPERVVDESCWSNEEFCRDKKLWLALGKTVAEKAAWRKSKELKLKLVTICPGLLMATSFPYAHRETSVPYLKGGSAMLQNGVLATADVKKVAEAHIHVYEAMDYDACGRYLCFDRVVQKFDEAIQIENELRMHGLLCGGRIGVLTTETHSSNLSNSRLTKLLLQASQRKSCKDETLIKC